MKMNCFIIQLKYSPGVFKEFTLMGEKLKQHGYKVYYIVAKQYKWMFDSIKINKDRIYYFSSSENLKTMISDSIKYIFKRYLLVNYYFKKNQPYFICFYGAHPINFLITRMLKKNYPDSKVCVFVHEPFKIDKTKLTFSKKFYFTYLEFLQGLSLKYSNNVILPSPYAKQLFNIKYPWFKNEIHYSPLMIPNRPYSELRNRVYFTMVGNIFQDGRLQNFLDIIKLSVEMKYNFKFQIVSSSGCVKKLKLSDFSKNGILNIINKSNLTDVEIYKAVSNSKAVLMLHTQGSQSGVVPVSYMNGTPIIARAIPALSQHILHKNTGYIVKKDKSILEWIKAITYVNNNLNVLSKNSLNFYNKYIHEKNWEKYYEWI